MKIKKIRLQKFRQFSDTTFEVGPFNVVVGPNNCGKTSLLHAIRAFFLLMRGHVRFEDDPPIATYHRRFLATAEEIAPTPDIKELWYRQQAGGKLTISVTFEDDETLSVVIRQQFGQIHVSADELPPGLTAMDASRYLDTQVAFIPGLVGVLVTEPYATGARRNALATQGRYSEIFRSSLQQLKGKNSDLVEKINEWLSDLFGIVVSRIEFDGEADEFVTVKYEENNTEFDVVSSGAGLQQVIQMLTYLYLSQPRILLIDEPDAHLHSKLQARLGELFRRVSIDLDAQVFLSTHSLDLIDTFSTQEVLIVDSKKRLIKPIGDNSDLISVLVDADVVDVSSLSRLLSSRRLVVIEDRDKSIFKAIDRAIGNPLFSSKSSSYVLPAEGVGNFRAIAQLGKVLKALTQTTFDVTFVQDRDGMPEFMVSPFELSQQSDDVKPYLLKRHEIENYLIEPDLIERAAAMVGRTVTSAQAADAILKAGQTLKAKARRTSLDTAKKVNRHLDQGKVPDSDLEEKVYEWFDALDLTAISTIQSVFPGKETIQEALSLINQGAERNLTRGHLVTAITSELVAPEICELLRTLGDTPPASTPSAEQLDPAHFPQLHFGDFEPAEEPPTPPTTAPDDATRPADSDPVN
jgi:ABC-type cobalamin/Fe3+-siderophores transport system ATPase subunit